MREGDVVAGLRIQPLLDFRLVLGRAIERQLDPQHREQHQQQESPKAKCQDLAELANGHLHQNDVVLSRGVERLSLQADRFARDQFELA